VVLDDLSLTRIGALPYIEATRIQVPKVAGSKTVIHCVKIIPFVIVLLVSYGCGMPGPASLKEDRNRYNQVIAYTGSAGVDAPGGQVISDLTGGIIGLHEINILQPVCQDQGTFGGAAETHIVFRYLVVRKS